MRSLLGFAASLVTLAYVAAWAQKPQSSVGTLSPLPRPSTSTATAPSTPQPFEPDPSGGFSRTVFQTNQHPDFNLVIRDFSFPPDRQAHTVVLSSAALLHVITGNGEVSIAKKRYQFTSLMRRAVSAGDAIEIVNTGPQAMIVRVLIVEAK